jgi:hypothetical protein
MTMVSSAHRSTFGMRCAHCNTALIAPEWTEERNERQIGKADSLRRRSSSANSCEDMRYAPPASADLSVVNHTR